MGLLKWAIILAVLALIAGVLGFGELAGAFSGIAKFLFVLFLILVVIFGILGFLAYKKAKTIL